MTTDLILGTAGHIDHGKTSLIRALTGVDTDRLPEEKKRGITIELGFAELEIGEFRLGIVDVPGHERFVRNMLAGATGMDLAMLVVAADDSIKQQTREHLEILRLLNLKHGVIALTKCDLSDPDWIDLVEEEIRELVKDSFLAEAPIVRTSAPTGEGIEPLRAALETAAAKATEDRRISRSGGPFRMAIDRTFTMTGHGAVVTGSVGSGSAKVGDILTIEPGSVEVRIRSLQNHDRSVEEIHRGQRAAINLAGVHHDEIRRGQELASKGHLLPSRLLTVQLSLLRSAPRPLKNRSRVRIHIGTAEILASVSLIGRDRLERGETCPAQLFLSEEVVAIWRQPLVVRSESPVITIGGGQVLDPNAEKIRKADEQVLAQLKNLASHEPVTRAAAAAYFCGFRDFAPKDFTRIAGVEDSGPVMQTLLEQGDVLELAVSPTRVVRLHRLVLERLSRRIETVLGKLHDQHPLQIAFPRQRLAQGFTYVEEPIFKAALERLKNDGKIKITQQGAAQVGRGPKLSKNEQKLLTELIERFRQAGIQPPTVKECQQQAAKNQDSVPQLLALAAANGELVEITPEFYLHSEVEQKTRQLLQEKLASGKGLKLSEIREILETTRKYAVPVCEYYDSIGFTRREGDLRVLAKSP